MKVDMCKVMVLVVMLRYTIIWWGKEVAAKGDELTTEEESGFYLRKYCSIKYTWLVFSYHKYVPKPNSVKQIQWRVCYPVFCTSAKCARYIKFGPEKLPVTSDCPRKLKNKNNSSIYVYAPQKSTLQYYSITFHKENPIRNAETLLIFGNWTTNIVHS